MAEICNYEKGKAYFKGEIFMLECMYVCVCVCVCVCECVNLQSRSHVPAPCLLQKKGAIEIFRVGLRIQAALLDSGLKKERQELKTSIERLLNAWGSFRAAIKGHVEVRVCVRVCMCVCVCVYLLIMEKGRKNAKNREKMKRKRNRKKKKN